MILDHTPAQSVSLPLAHGVSAGSNTAAYRENYMNMQQYSEQ